MFDLKDFNYKYIYSKANTKEQLEYYRNGMNSIYTRYLNDIKNNNTDSEIFTIYINNMDESYLKNTSPERIVIDYIAGMTDEFFNTKILKKC